MWYQYDTGFHVTFESHRLHENLYGYSLAKFFISYYKILYAVETCWLDKTLSLIV